MKNSIFIVAILLTSCAFVGKKELSETLIGDWCELAPGDTKCAGYMNYHANGTYSAHGKTPEYDERWESYGIWELNGDSVCVTPQKRLVFKLSTGKQLDTSAWPLENYCDKVVEFSSDRIVIDTPYFEEHSVLIKENKT